MELEIDPDKEMTLGDRFARNLLNEKAEKERYATALRIAEALSFFEPIACIDITEQRKRGVKQWRLDLWHEKSNRIGTRIIVRENQILFMSESKHYESMEGNLRKLAPGMHVSCHWEIPMEAPQHKDAQFGAFSLAIASICLIGVIASLCLNVMTWLR